MSHTLAYSLIALQEMNLAYNYPIIFWNCACLISDSGGTQSNNNEEDEEDFIEEIYEADNDLEFGSENEEDDDEDESEEKVKKTSKKSQKVTDYGKIATAIGKFKFSGIEVTPPNINKSSYTFSPDVENNIIRSGLSGITRVGEDLINSILNNRPYTSIEDFLSKNKVTKPQMVNLIKSGAMDELVENNDRSAAMREYVNLISDKKKRVTLQNMKMLIDFGLIPQSLNHEVKVFNFNKYLKKFKDGTYYLIDDRALGFIDRNYSLDMLVAADLPYQFKVSQAIWDKIYKKEMDKVRAYIKENYDYLLESMNNKLEEMVWNKYCTGSISSWEMDSISYYNHEHELSNIREDIYNIYDFNGMGREPEIDRFLKFKGKEIPIFKIKRIAGTVLDKDKNKKTITLLTTTGVVTVKIYGDAFTYYNKQISEKQDDGTKKVMEKSWFTRGNKIIVTGIRRDENFIAKKYKNTPYHLVEKIQEVKEDGRLITQKLRYGDEEEE